MTINETTSEIVSKIHETPTKAVILVTGGGLGIFPELTQRGGGSATLLSGFIPYDPEETYELIGGKPDKLVSEETTRVMAMAAFQRALKLSKGQYPVAGVASSSVLQRVPTEREGRVHYIYTALQTDSYTTSATLTINDPKQLAVGLNGGSNPHAIRLLEEDINTRMILDLIAEGCGVMEQATPAKLNFIKGCSVQRKRSPFLDVSVSKIMNGTRILFNCYPGGEIQPVVEKRGVNVANHTWAGSGYAADHSLIFPGSFKPLHVGHMEMAAIAEQKYKMPLAFEISIGNADKPCMDLLSLGERLKGFTGQKELQRVWVTNVPTFVQKSNMFPGAIFVVGYDTALRIVDPKFAGPVDDVLNTFKRNRTRFLVFGRDKSDGTFQSGLADFPRAFQDISEEVSQRFYFSHVSSTGIRNGAAL